MKKFAPIAYENDVPIYEMNVFGLACDYGMAPLDKLEVTLKKQAIDPNGIIHLEGKRHTPIIATTVEYGMYEHTKLLLEQGAKTTVRFAGHDGRRHNLGTCLLTTEESLGGKLVGNPVELFKLLEAHGFDWINDRVVNTLHSLINSRVTNVYKTFAYMLNNPQIKQLDYLEKPRNLESLPLPAKPEKITFITNSLARHRHHLALEAIEAGLSMEGAWGALMNGFTGFSDELKHLTVQFLNYPAGRLSFQKFYDTWQEDFPAINRGIRIFGEGELTKWLNYAQRIYLDKPIDPESKPAQPLLMRL